MVVIRKSFGIDDYAKDGGQGRSDLDVVFTMVFCATNFFIASRCERGDLLRRAHVKMMFAR